MILLLGLKLGLLFARAGLSIRLEVFSPGRGPAAAMRKGELAEYASSGNLGTKGRLQRSRSMDWEASSQKGFLAEGWRERKNLLIWFVLGR